VTKAAHRTAKAAASRRDVTRGALRVIIEERFMGKDSPASDLAVGANVRMLT
jgi:hypothetical protein